MGLTDFPGLSAGNRLTTATPGLSTGNGLVGGSLDPATTALIARMSPAPTSARAIIINNLIVALKAAGVWALTDVLYVLAAAAEQNAQLNWKSSSYTASPVSSPTFTIDRGYTGNGSSSYLTTGFDPTAAPAGLIMAQDSAHIGAIALTAGTTNGFECGAPNNRGKVRCRPTTSGASGSLSTSTSVTQSAANTLPLYACVVRRDSANQLLFSQGVQSATLAVASAGLMSSFEILRSVASYTDRQVAITHAGGALSDAQIAAANTAFRTYLTAVGAI